MKRQKYQLWSVQHHCNGCAQLKKHNSFLPACDPSRSSHALASNHIKSMLCREVQCSLIEAETPFSSTSGVPKFLQLPGQVMDEKYAGIFQNLYYLYIKVYIDNKIMKLFSHLFIKITKFQCKMYKENAPGKVCAHDLPNCVYFCSVHHTGIAVYNILMKYCTINIFHFLSICLLFIHNSTIYSILASFTPC